MPKASKTLNDPLVLEAALEGLELQKRRIEAQMTEIRTQLGKRQRPAAEMASAVPKKRNLSADARKRIATAQKKRWAEYRRSSGNSK
jgi:hypothetical protein